MSAPYAFTPLTSDTAPDSVRPVIVGSARRFGFVPDPVARVAHSPVALRHVLAGFAAFDHTSLALVEREVVAMTVAWENECHYCMAMHTAMLSAQPEHAGVVDALRTGAPIPDARLEALRAFARAVVRERGQVSARLQGELREAGFGEEQVLEIVLGIGTYQLSTLLNIVTGAEVDAPFRAFAWERPAPEPPARLEVRRSA